MDSPVAARPWRVSVTHTVNAGFVLLIAASIGRLLTQHGPIWYCLLVLALCTALTATYATGQVLRSRAHRAAAWLAALVSIWALLVLLAPAFLWIAVPIACHVVGTLPRRAAGAVVLGMSGLLVLVQLRDGGWPNLDAVIAPVVAVWIVAALYHRQLRDNERRGRLIAELTSARAELARSEQHAGALAERSRLAAEIHDSLAQELASTRLLLQAAEREWHRHPELSLSHLRRAVQAIGDSLLEARRFISDLAPAALDDVDLSDALARLCARTTCDATSVRFRATGRRLDLAPDVDKTLLRVAQGALANAREHAAARRVWVTLSYLDDVVVLRLRDDGVGFDPTVAASRGADRGFGMVAMRDRLRAQGGVLTVDSAPGAGTTLAATIPVPGTDPAPAPRVPTSESAVAAP